MFQALNLLSNQENICKAHLIFTDVKWWENNFLLHFPAGAGAPSLHTPVTASSISRRWRGGIAWGLLDPHMDSSSHHITLNSWRSRTFPFSWTAFRGALDGPLCSEAFPSQIIYVSLPNPKLTVNSRDKIFKNNSMFLIRNYRFWF